MAAPSIDLKNPDFHLIGPPHDAFAWLRAFAELFTRLPELRPCAQPRRLRSNFINGVKELPVAF